MNSLTRRYRLAQPEPGDFMPPNLASMGAVPFGASQRNRLHAWLREGGWPRDCMDIAELEGYLVALVAWPVDIPCGAWLPPIWGEQGWKVPSKLATRSRYEEFVALILGFMQSIDRDLSRPSTRFESSLLRGLQERALVSALRRWSIGFTGALARGSQGLKWRDVSARAAVRTIASVTSTTPISSDAVEDIVSAVLLLIECRGSRGPLGALDPAILRDSAKTETITEQSSATDGAVNPKKRRPERAAER